MNCFRGNTRIMLEYFIVHRTNSNLILQPQVCDASVTSYVITRQRLTTKCTCNPTFYSFSALFTPLPLSSCPYCLPYTLTARNALTALPYALNALPTPFLPSIDPHCPSDALTALPPPLLPSLCPNCPPFALTALPAPLLPSLRPYCPPYALTALPSPLLPSLHHYCPPYALTALPSPLLPSLHHYCPPYALIALPMPLLPS